LTVKHRDISHGLSPWGALQSGFFLVVSLHIFMPHYAFRPLLIGLALQNRGCLNSRFFIMKLRSSSPPPVFEASAATLPSANPAARHVDKTALNKMHALMPRGGSLTQSFTPSKLPNPNVRPRFKPPADLLSKLPGQVLRHIANTREPSGAYTLSAADVAHLRGVNRHLRNEVVFADRADVAGLTAAATALAAPPPAPPLQNTDIPQNRPELEAILGGPGDAPDAQTIKNLPPELQSAPLAALMNNLAKWPASQQKVTEAWSIYQVVSALEPLYDTPELNKATVSLMHAPMREFLLALPPVVFEHYLKGQMDEFFARLTGPQRVNYDNALDSSERLDFSQHPFATPHALAAHFSTDRDSAESRVHVSSAENPTFFMPTILRRPGVAATLREARTNPDALAQLPSDLRAVRPLIQALQALLPQVLW
jgi:hypothetical protein